MNGAFHAPPPGRPARLPGGRQPRQERAKNTPRARAAFQGRTRPFACNSMQPLIQVLPKLVKQHVPLGENSSQEQHQQKNRRRCGCFSEKRLPPRLSGGKLLVQFFQFARNGFQRGRPFGKTRLTAHGVFDNMKPTSYEVNFI